MCPCRTCDQGCRLRDPSFCGRKRLCRNRSQIYLLPHGDSHAVADQLKQHRALQLAAPHVRDIVDHQQAVATQLLDQGRQLNADLGCLQQLLQGSGREEAAGLGLLDHSHRDGNGQVGLSHAAGAK